MAKSIKLRAKAKGEVVEVKALISHPMETGLRKDKKTGKVIPAHFIKEVIVEYGAKKVLTAHWGGSVSKNPYLSLKFKGGKKGDTVKLSWTDNKDKSDSAEGKIK